MKLLGSIPTACPPERVLSLLQDPIALGKIAPEGFVFAERSAQAVPFTFRRRIGVIVLNLAGQVSLRQTADKGDSHVAIEANHRIGGGVSIGLDVTAQTSPDGGQILAWSGTLEANGLTARIVKERASEAHKIVTTLFERLADQAVV
jgi:carbon monoxide dehydrogenase subunit G